VSHRWWPRKGRNRGGRHGLPGAETEVARRQQTLGRSLNRDRGTGWSGRGWSSRNDRHAQSDMDATAAANGCARTYRRGRALVGDDVGDTWEGPLVGNVLSTSFLSAQDVGRDVATTNGVAASAACGRRQSGQRGSGRLGSKEACG
jgi:hypothetical protein